MEFVPGAPEGCVTIATVTLNDPGAHMAVDGAIEQHHGFLPLPDVAGPADAAHRAPRRRFLPVARGRVPRVDRAGYRGREST